MLKIKTYVNNNNDLKNIITQQKNKIVQFKGKEYTYVGKSKEDPSKLTRVLGLGEVFAMTLTGCLIIPCFSKTFRKTFKHAWNELCSGQSIIKHYVENINVFDPTPVQNWRKQLPTQQECYLRGKNNANNIKFD